jgi:hypothetical protein
MANLGERSIYFDLDLEVDSQAIAAMKGSQSPQLKPGIRVLKLTLT